MDEISPFQKSIEEMLIDLSEFLRKINPNPFVAIAAFEIYKNQMISWGIFDIIIEPRITNDEVIELVSALEEFFRTFAAHPEYIATTLEIAKYQFLNEISKKRK